MRKLCLLSFVVAVPACGGGGSSGPPAEKDDDFPLPRTQRKVGHQVQTFLVGLEVAAQTEQLAFGPAIAAQRHVSNGALIEIPIAGYEVTEPLTFACNVDRVSARLRTVLGTALRTAMTAMTSSRPV